VDQYLAGRTPIACTNCNTDVKFEPLLRMARQIGAGVLPLVTTREFARTEYPADGNCCARATNQGPILLPLGTLAGTAFRSDFPSVNSPRESTALARRANLPVSKSRSMELCFVPNGS